MEVQYLTVAPELVVAESVIVVTRLLQSCTEERLRSVIALAKLLDTIAVPMARANIIWLIGQHVETLPKVGPDVLRQVAKNFSNETNVSKLQVLTLSAKLVCNNPDNATLNTLNQYVLNLARYDTNYDVRDRARFLRALTMPHNGDNRGLDALKMYLKKILLSDKEPPAAEGGVQGAEYTIGSLSMLANQSLPDYEPLPDYPEEQPDTSVRDVHEMEGWSGSRTMVMEQQGFGSDSFESRYRNGSGVSTALSGIEATGFHSGSSNGMYNPVAKRKGGEYDLDAFYDDSSDEYEGSSDEDEETSSDEDEDEDEDESSSEEESEEVSEEESEEESQEESEEESSGGEDARTKLVRK